MGRLQIYIDMNVAGSAEPHGHQSHVAHALVSRHLEARPPRDRSNNSNIVNNSINSTSNDDSHSNNNTSNSNISPFARLGSMEPRSFTSSRLFAINRIAETDCSEVRIMNRRIVRERERERERERCTDTRAQAHAPT